MKHLALVALVIGCSSGSSSKQPTMPPAEPTPPAPPADQAAKQEPPAEPAPPPAPDTGGYRLVAPSGLQYQAVDPAATAPGPEIAIVSGDLQKGGAFFLKLPAGAKPGLHTHSADYHAVLISGAHKHWQPGEDKKAKVLPPGSYWYQPGKQAHGDECTGAEPCVIYVVMDGAFDFAPAPKAKPDKANKAFTKARKDYKFAPIDPSKPDGTKMAVVDGDPKTGPVAFMIEVPANGNAGLHSHTAEYHALVIDGAPAHWLPHEKGEGEPLAAGTYWFQPGGYDHGDRCTGTAPCHVFVMMPKALDFKPAGAKK
jgi:beta-alanine degradation protein BauB